MCDNKLIAILKSDWSVLFVGLLVRQLIAICGAIAFLTNATGYYIGSFLFELIPPNNGTVNTTELEKRLNSCMGGWNMGVELLTFIIVIIIFLSKRVLLEYIINGTESEVDPV